jgi:hypothetical protein
LDDRRHHCDLRVVFVPLGTPPGGRIKALVMSDVSQRLRVQAKLKELIERASTAAEITSKTVEKLPRKVLPFEKMAHDLPSNPFQRPATLRRFQ